MKRLIAFLLVLVFLIPCSMPVSAESTSHLSVESTVFFVGEPIMVTATGSGKDWIGIVPCTAEHPEGDVSKASIRWKYIAKGQGQGASAGQGSGVATDIRTGETWNTGKYGTELIDIPAGKYAIIFVPNDGLAAKATERLYITVNSIKTDKSTYLAGEPIMVTATGSGKDWIGIIPCTAEYPEGDTSAAIRWKYIAEGQGQGEGAGQGSGVATDIRTGEAWDTNKHDAALIDIPAGKYAIIFVPNDGRAAKATQKLYITVNPIKTDKLTYLAGEPIMVTAIGSGKDWIGIVPCTAEYPEGDTSKGAIRWKYIAEGQGQGASAGQGSGVATDIRTGQTWNTGKFGTELIDIPAGE